MAASSHAPVLLRYRLAGGPVRIDHLLTIREDASAELDERHRSREPIRFEIPSRELDRIRALLGELSPPRHGLGERLSRMFSGGDMTRIRLEWDGGKITRTDPDDPALAELLNLLDEIRLRAMRSQPR
ncbi:MAG: hypothetical protein ACJ75R_00985 [Solirubrobacterales bacterium]